MAVRDKRTEWLRVELYRRMSSEERILVAARMFDDMVSVVRSSIVDSHPGISAEALEHEVRRRVLPPGLAKPPKARARPHQ